MVPHALLNHQLITEREQTETFERQGGVPVAYPDDDNDAIDERMPSIKLKSSNNNNDKSLWTLWTDQSQNDKQTVQLVVVQMNVHQNNQPITAID